MFKIRTRKLNIFYVVALVGLLLFIMLLGGCQDGNDGEKTVCENHNFVRIEDGGNRQPTYDLEGRELRECTECGLSAYFIIPKLERTSGTLSEGYLPLLDSYVVEYGDTLNEVATRYFTTGWTFLLDGETTVGDVSAIGYDFTVRFTPADNAYSSVDKDVKLIVKKATLTENDIYLNDPLNIPDTATSLEQVPLTLKDEQIIKGTITWVEGQEILRNQSAYYEYVFTPEDGENYEVFVGKLLLNA